MFESTGAVRTIAGVSIPPISTESATVVLVTTAECDKSRAAIASLVQLQPALVSRRFAFRTVLRSEIPAAKQYARLLPDPASVIGGEASVAFRGLRVHSVPMLFLIEPSGHVIARAPLPVDVGELDQVIRHLSAYSSP